MSTSTTKHSAKTVNGHNPDAIDSFVAEEGGEQ